MLKKIEDVKKEIEGGKSLLCAGDESALKKLPKGNWIGGTTPYFMSEDGGKKDSNKVFVTEFSNDIKLKSIKSYDESSLNKIVSDSDDTGLSIILIPAFSKVHKLYAETAPDIPKLFEKQIVGWITGYDLDSKEKLTAKVFNGKTGEIYENKIIALHLSLPENKKAEIKIVNIFEQGTGDTITFKESGFEAKECLVNGKKTDFVKYIKDNNIDTKLPLVANYFGVMINSSIMSVGDSVKLYAPVFDSIDYKIAKPVVNYEKAFNAIISDDKNVTFCCNCILNFLYGELENKKTGAFIGPISFGEIAYQLLNQTLVYVTIEKR